MKPKNIEISLTPDLGQAQVLYDFGKNVYQLHIDMHDIYQWYFPDYSYEYWKETYQIEEIKDYFKTKFKELHEHAEVLYI